MKDAGTRGTRGQEGQGTRASDLVRSMVVRCAAAGCTNLRWADEKFCAKCAEEIAALRRMAQLHDERETRRRQRMYHAAIQFEMVCMRVRRWLWLPMLATVMAGLLYFFGQVFGEAFCIWMDGAQ